MALSGKGALKYFSVDTAAAATVSLVTAVPGKKIVLVNYTLVLGGVTSVTWKSNTTAKSGAMGAGAACVIDASGTPESPCLETAIGEALQITNSAAVQVSGHGTYVEDY